MVSKEIEVDDFDKILVHKKIALIISEGSQQKVIVETGKNLLPDIQIEVIEGEIILRNNNNCNFLRDYNLTKVYITSPNITKIRNASEQSVTSTGTLTYPSLYLMSAGNKSKYLAVGDIRLNINNNVVQIWSNGIATIYLEGKTNNLNISFSDGNTRFEGRNFIANNIAVNNVSSNDMIINPIESLTGKILSTGNVISYHLPPIVDVETPGIGKLIFKQ